MFIHSLLLENIITKHSYKIVYKINTDYYTVTLYMHTHSRLLHAHVHMQGINVGGGPNEDPVGHGTNVAGCAMSTTYGAAKLGTAIAVGIDRDGYPATE